MIQSQYKLHTKIGNIYLVASVQGLQSVSFEKQKSPMLKSLDSAQPVARMLKKATEQLEQYFGGKRKVFDLPLDMQGTAFQKKVWQALLQIPYGQTQSYKDVAAKIKKAKAVRAVGSANGKNPICVIVPCHRVIAANGKIGGYSGGLKIKAELLKLEHSL
jgi:methylated-DNA-[protein]-cysteine S-methyltransferase